MKQTINHLAVFILAIGFLSACTQSTPSMMNVSKIELAHETIVEQIPLSDVTDSNMSVLASHYHKNGKGPVDLTMTYDPKSKTFTAMKAIHALKKAEGVLKRKGLNNISAQTLAVPDGKPSLMVSYDIARAQAPSDCGHMPGLQSNDTTRFIDEYKFGCGVETMVAKQVAHPSDLEGTSEMGSRPARRDAVVLDGYSSGAPREPLDGIERDDLSSE